GRLARNALQVPAERDLAEDQRGEQPVERLRDSGVTRAPGALLWTWIQVGRLQRRLCPRQRPIRNGPRLEIFMNRLQNSLLADARVHAAAVGDADRDDDLVGARRIGYPDGHRLEVVERPRVVLVAERQVERRARGGDPLRGRD